MALRLSDAEEFSRRLAYCLRAAKLTGEELSRKIGRPDNHLSWVMTQAKRVNLDLTGQICEGLAGEGALTQNSLLIVQFLLGIEHDAGVVLRGRDSNPQPSDFGWGVPIPEEIAA